MSLALALMLAVTPAAPEAGVPAAPAWLRVETPGTPRVQALWETLQWRRANRRADGSFPADGGVAPDLHYHPVRALFSETDGPYPGDWTFIAATADAPRPNAAWRLSPVEGGVYGMQAELLCDDEPACRQARVALSQLRAPPPALADQFEGWLQVVATEACEPGPSHMPAPAYPGLALRDQSGGRVVLDLLVNRCGEVRTLRIQQSAGDRHIDRAAVRTARGWRLPPPENGAAYATMRVPILFELAPPDSAAPAD